MTSTAPSSVHPADQAARNLHRNLAALRQTQPALVEPAAGDAAIIEWRIARDGSLSGFEAPNRFIGGCSVPAALADELLASVRLASPAVCYLAPTHAAEIALALRTLRPTQVLWVAWPEIEPLRRALRLHDFSEQIEQRRLWFAAGPRWTDCLSEILKEHDGLALPAQLVRTPLLPAGLAESMPQQLRTILEHVTEHRSGMLANIRTSTTRSRRICVWRPSSFSIWEDAAETLWQCAQIAGWNTMPVDPDNVLGATSLAVAKAIAGAEALLIADRGRADLWEMVNDDTAIITWMTSPRQIAWSGNARDAVLICQERWRAQLIRSGWPANRIGLAQWPVQPRERRAGPLAMIADTTDVNIDLEQFDLSSHRVLWELIRDELLNDPLSLGLDPAAYLRERMHRLEVAPDGLDEDFWLSRLIIPAWQQGQVRMLRGAGINVRVHGAGWKDGTPNVARGQLHQAIERSAGLILPAPVDHAHPCEAMGLPVLRPMTPSKWIESARHITAGNAKAIPPTRPLSAALLGDLLR